MSLETLLEAARYVEQQEKKRERAASTSSSDHLFAVAPHSNHHNSNEPRDERIMKNIIGKYNQRRMIRGRLSTRGGYHVTLVPVVVVCRLSVTDACLYESHTR
ncbi:hypothetical protein PV325_012893 [Microctonus aethiopoides]|nr:hypothetical protein PV325_012893 [Microctonus aethiopoides]